MGRLARKRIAVVVCAGNQIGIASKEPRNLSQVAVLGCVMKQTAQHGIAPGQRNQDKQHDGGAERARGVEESTEERIRLIHGSSKLVPVIRFLYN
jgi:hypothetical protein